MSDKLLATVVRDTAEKAGFGWSFAACDWCAGTVPGNLPTADYALRGPGLDGRVLLERKRSTAELAMNVFEARFPDVLARMADECDYPFVVCEFPFARIADFPAGSGIPRGRHRSVRVTPHLLLKRVVELQLDFPTVRWQWCDNAAWAQAFARSVFKRLVERAREAAGR